MAHRKLFCEYNRTFYAISLKKECSKRLLRDLFSGEHYAKDKSKENLPVIVKSHRSIILRKLNNVDMQLQKNKAINLRLSSAKVDGITIKPGETFSFWRLIGNCTKRRGYLPGLIISNSKTGSGIGGGICQLANLIHWLVLHSPLEITEIHHHTDALFPDSGRRVPFGTGTSVCYNSLDYRFKNTTEDTYQLRVWTDETDLCGELRCSREIPLRYRIEETDSFYSKEKDGYYRNSKVWRKEIDKATKKVIRQELILDNHSRVMYDPSLIPEDEIRSTPVKDRN